MMNFSSPAGAGSKDGSSVANAFGVIEDGGVVMIGRLDFFALDRDKSAFQLFARNI